MMETVHSEMLWESVYWVWGGGRGGLAWHEHERVDEGGLDTSLGEVIRKPETETSRDV